MKLRARQRGNEAFIPKYYHVMLVALPILFLIVTPGLAFAWEFSIESSLLNFRYIYASQAGSNGFFGPFNIDMSSQGGGNLAPLNGWFETRMLTGTTAMLSSTRMAIFPVLKLNQAVAVRGTYRIGQDATSTNQVYENPDIETTFSDGRWTRLWMTVDTPMGRIYYGKRGFQQGLGLQFGSAETADEIFEADRRTVELFQLETFYGPFTFGAGFYPRRRGSVRYWNPDDQNSARTIDVLGYARYAAGKVDIGVGGFYFAFHEGPEALKTVETRKKVPPSDTAATEGWLYLKYNNGRIVLNAEADWYYRTIKYQPAMDGSIPGPGYDMNGTGYPSGNYQPPYIESWRYMVEFGVYAGPAKVSFLLAHMPGPDRRHGILIDRQPYIQAVEESGFQVFYPYNILMGKYYRAGVNSFRDMSASNVAGLRSNYMVASNLDIIASVMMARRSSDGYGWGYVKPDPTKNRFGYLSFKNAGSFDMPTPNIVERDLGWEFDVGIVWKLLENWRLYMRGAYWQPGKWFNYACVDKSVPQWDIPSSANNYGINPNRTIDPILGFELFLDARL
ncbi:MAG: hypothetical protein ACLPVO_16055 [Desulfomonilaceae bacterium]